MVIAVVVMLIILKGPSWEKIVTSEIRLPYETENPQIKLYGIKNSTEDMREICRRTWNSRIKRCVRPDMSMDFIGKLKPGGITKWEIMSPAGNHCNRNGNNEEPAAYT